MCTRIIAFFTFFTRYMAYSRYGLAFMLRGPDGRPLGFRVFRHPCAPAQSDPKSFQAVKHVAVGYLGSGVGSNTHFCIFITLNPLHDPYNAIRILVHMGRKPTPVVPSAYMNGFGVMSANSSLKPCAQSSIGIIVPPIIISIKDTFCEQEDDVDVGFSRTLGMLMLRRGTKLAVQPSPQLHDGPYIRAFGFRV